jgi:hypothetical protein
MPIQPNQIPRLTRLLLHYDYNFVVAWYQQVLNEDPAGVIPAMATRWDAIWALLTSAYARGRIDEFLAAMDEPPTLAAAITELLGRDLPCPTTANLINPRRAFIDRADLRQKLAEMLADDSLAILAISGDEASGKSYSGHLIAHVAERTAGARLIWVKLADLVKAPLDSTSGEPRELEPYELMEALASPSGLAVRSDLRMTRAQDSRIIQKLIAWYEGVFDSRNTPAQPVWLIIDDLNFEACPAWIPEFMTGFCARRGRGAFSHLRIFLIGFDMARLNSDAQDLATGDLAIPPGRDHLWEFLTAAAAEKGRILPLSQKATTLDAIWGTKDPPLRHQELREIAKRATDFIGSLHR